jgi:hypothetical protein
MTLLGESINLCISIAPAMLAITLACLGARRPGSWFLILVGSAFLAVLSVGLLLSRLVTQCAGQAPTCDAGLVAKPIISGIFAQCYSCYMAKESSQVAAFLSNWAIAIQAASALACVLASIVTTVRFAVWTKRLLQGSARS